MSDNQDKNQEVEQIYESFRREMSMILERYLDGYNTLKEAYELCDCSGRLVLSRLIKNFESKNK